MLFFPPVTLFFSFYPQLHYFFPPSYTISSFFPPVKLLNSVAAKIAQDIYYKNNPRVKLFSQLHYFEIAQDIYYKKQPSSYAISTYARFF